jgi:(p)ppGpp synthase/HD superfamily hydrolase
LSSIFAALWNHDTIEDARVTYNDLKSRFGKFTAELVYAVTNEKGRTRKDRANDKYYNGIRETEYATFIKLCDRIANVRFGKSFGGKSDMYRKEQVAFEEGLNGGSVVPGNYSPEFEKYFPMVEYLRELLNG